MAKPSKKNTETMTFQVEKQSELLVFLLEVMNSSRNSVKSVLSRGQVTIDGKVETQYNAVLEKGQTVSILGNKAAKNLDTLREITVLYEDDDLIVVNKQAGLLTVAAPNSTEDTAISQLTAYMKNKNSKNRVFVVHRLDKFTSGVLLFAKSEQVKQKLQSAWNETVKERKYVALVEGNVKKQEGKVSSWLKENKAYKVYSSPTDNGGQLAITRYEKRSYKGGFTLLDVFLETGRKNQIRVHMEDIGHPIAGDKKYGSTTNPIKRLGLHAEALAIIHPSSGELIRFHSKMPSSFNLKGK